MPSAKVYGGAYDGLEVTFDPGPLPDWIALDNPAPPIEKREDGKIVYTMQEDRPPAEYYLEYVQETESGFTVWIDIDKPVIAIYVPKPMVVFELERT